MHVQCEKNQRVTTPKRGELYLLTPTKTGQPFRPFWPVRLLLFYTMALLGRIMKLIELNLDKIIELCKKFHVRRLWVFGSILTSRFNDKSDVDLCVDFDWDNIPLMEAADNFFDFQYALEDIFGRKVDLTDDSAVRNPYFREELNEKRRLIYG